MARRKGITRDIKEIRADIRATPQEMKQKGVRRFNGGLSGEVHRVECPHVCARKGT